LQFCVDLADFDSFSHFVTQNYADEIRDSSKVDGIVKVTYEFTAALEVPVDEITFSITKAA
jgi:hypothetical protein